MVLYLITNKIDGKRYVGQTTDTIDKRWNQHKSKYSCCRYLLNAIKKYGPDFFDKKVLARCVSMEEMNHRETYYIRLFNTLAPNGYNLNTGGSNRMASQETKHKMSISQKGIKKPRSAEHAKKLGLTKLGTKQSQKEKDKRAESLFQAVEVPELGIIFKSYGHASKALGTHNHVIRAVINGIKCEWKGLTFKKVEKNFLDFSISAESQILLDFFLKNKTHGWTGKKRSPEENKKNSFRNQKPIFCPELNKKFDSIKIAAKELGLRESGVGNVARGKGQTCGGYTFRFIEGNK